MTLEIIHPSGETEFYSDEQSLSISGWARVTGIPQTVIYNAARRADVPRDIVHLPSARRPRSIHLIAIGSFPNLVKGIQDSRDVSSQAVVHDWAQTADTSQPEFEVTTPTGYKLVYQADT